jgi:transcriptional regulator with XRE-family HTH domain
MGMQSPTDSCHPTDEQVGRHLAALRQVMGVDVQTLAARAQLDSATIAAIEAGTRSPTLDELSDFALALGVTVTSIFRRLDSVPQ